MLSIIRDVIINGCTTFAHTLMPQDCLLCGARGGPLCAPCHADLPWHDATQCPRCAVPSTHGALCGQCLKAPPAFDRVVAPLQYAFPADALIQGLKYGQRLALASVLAAPLAKMAADSPRPDVLIPMPLHPHRLRERGFNQAHELARALGRSLDVPLMPDAATRIRPTVPQVGLPWKERATNLRGAFSSTSDLAGKHVALVDDVMTTGASLHELALALRRRGAEEVSAWVVARTIPS